MLLIRDSVKNQLYFIRRWHGEEQASKISSLPPFDQEQTLARTFYCFQTLKMVMNSKRVETELRQGRGTQLIDIKKESVQKQQSFTSCILQNLPGGILPSLTFALISQLLLLLLFVLLLLLLLLPTYNMLNTTKFGFLQSAETSLLPFCLCW